MPGGNSTPISITTGNAATSGNITIDTGAGSTTKGNINIGSLNTTVNLPATTTNIGATTLVNGSVAATVTLPATTTTLIGDNTSSKLTNKTFAVN